MTENMDRVTITEPLAYELAREVRARGYKIASYEGIAQGEPDHSGFGILKPREDIQKRFLGIGYSSKQRALHTGTLLLNNEVRKAVEDENWILEVYGRPHIPEMTTLMQELAEPRNIDVEIKLMTERLREETKHSDYQF